jgi:dihydroxyacetone kinase
MTHVYNDPARFDADALAGFSRLHAPLVRQVVGGVVRRQPGPPGKVAVLYGGGSGHYPIFFGLVGPGLADGAVVGNIFTSPSAEYGYSVAKAAERGGGVVFTYGNSAGDVMNFTLAGQRLIAEGIDARQVIITDDVWSAPPEEADKRRGIAGDLVVFKILSAAAESGLGIDEVVRLGQAANDRTRSAGVAFTGCTLPGADHPLFSVEPGTMGVGLGVHGEPGLSTEPLESADALADRLIGALLAEAPAAGGPIGVILNGLGGTKYEELFVLWNAVAPRLEALGYHVVDPEVGELVTSLDMAGLSLTIVWLDQELEPLWRMPHYSPAWRKGGWAPGAVASGGAVDSGAVEAVGSGGSGAVSAGAVLGEAGAALSAEPTAGTAQAGAPAPGSAAPSTDRSRAVAQLVLDAINQASAAVAVAEVALGRLDAVAGDGDHGRGMRRGLQAAAVAARAAVEAGAGAGSVLKQAGSAWAAQAGGTSGVLWGSALQAASTVIGDTEVPGPVQVAQAAQAFVTALRRLGKANLADKTMLDAAHPFAEALAQALAQGQGLEAAWAAAAAVAEQAAQDTQGLVPKIGRARPHAKKSVGTPDPGAISFALVVSAVVDHG